METPTSTTERAIAGLPAETSQDGSGPDEPGGIPPLAVLAAAFVLGVLLARLLDWRTHAHPDD